MAAKAELRRALSNTSRPEGDIHEEILSIVKRRKMSAEAIVRAGCELNFAQPRPTGRRATVEEAIATLVLQAISAKRTAIVDDDQPVSEKHAPRTSTSSTQTTHSTTVGTSTQTDPSTRMTRNVESFFSW